jgi:hypothetical protein
MIELKRECGVFCKNNMTSHKKKRRKETSYLKKITICCSKCRRFKSANNNFDASFELDARLIAILDP